MNRGLQQAGPLIFLGFVLHAAYATDLKVHGVTPNLAVCCLLVFSLFFGPNAGAVMGFCTGLMEASFVADYVGSFIVTRTIAGFAVGALEERIYRDNAFVAVIATVAGTLLIAGCFFLFAPQPYALQYFTRALNESLYNGAVALPLYLVVRRSIRRAAAPATS